MMNRKRLREIIGALMESSVYLYLPLKERVRLIRRLYETSTVFSKACSN